MFGLNTNLGGLIDGAKRILDSGLSLVQSRLELLSAEIRAERDFFFRTVLIAAGMILLGALGLALFTATVVVAFWETAPLAVLGSFTLLYLVGAGLLYRRLKKELRTQRPLSGTIEEIKKDREYVGANR